MQQHQLRTVVIAVALSALAAGIAAQNQVPVPTGWVGGYDGYIYSGGAASAVKLDVFYDLICPDSAASWPGIQGVAGILGPDNLQVRIHSFPLPYHHNGFYAWQGAHYLASRNKGSLWSWVSAFYGPGSPAMPNQTAFYNKATQHMSQAEVIAAMAKLANQTTGGAVSVEEFTQAMAYGDQYDARTRASWKYSCSQGAFGTPMFRVNGVWFNSAMSTWSSEQWVSALTPFLPPQ